MVGLSLLQIPGIPGGPEVLIVLVIIVLLFGANKIPELAGALGQARGEFDKGRNEVEDELEEMQTSNVDADSGAAGDSTDAASQDNDVDYDPPEVNERNTEVESNQ
ncbi:twin-arginine translocase TatA/TatE family subunit [Halococcus salsus]|uniref:twin-arginine translocase TatA/TatE family subunit n=1 Tax=Halococcus salsus TaxID=2162894 RepID=UPI001357D238|nr:twin-arginine translocase TatA/TatE family subunit [Halococcus salsus]